VGGGTEQLLQGVREIWAAVRRNRRHCADLIICWSY
jgi:hypothetical protein